MIPAPSVPLPYRPEFTIIRTHEIIPAPLRSVTVQTGVYDHPYTRVFIIPAPSVPLPYNRSLRSCKLVCTDDLRYRNRPEFTIIRTHEFHYPCTLRSVTVQTGVYDHPYTRVSLSLHPPFRYRTDRSLRSSVHTSFIIPAPSVPLPYRPEFTIIRTHEFHYPAPIRSVTVQTGIRHTSLRSLHPSVPYRTDGVQG